MNFESGKLISFLSLILAIRFSFILSLILRWRFIPGDLTSNVSDSGIGELHSKRVARQIAAALEYMHLK